MFSFSKESKIAVKICSVSLSTEVIFELENKLRDTPDNVYWIDPDFIELQMVMCARAGLSSFEGSNKIRDLAFIFFGNKYLTVPLWRLHL